MDEIILELKGLKKSFGGKEVLKGVDLKVKRGEIIGYIGANGAGKSTTVKIMLGIVDGYEGDVIIFNKSIEDTKGEYKKKIGYVPEVSEVYESLTAIEYLNFIGQLYDLDVETLTIKGKELMKLFGIYDHLNQRISTLSKGMKQK